MARPPAVVVAEGPDAGMETGALGGHVRGWTEIALGDLPPEPFALGDARLAVVAAIGDARQAAAVLLAAARGVAVVVTIDVEPATADRFLDELSRVADVRHGDPPPTVALGDEHEALLGALAEGLTVSAAARRVGVSRRTAVRRLGEARALLGATSTTESVRLYADRTRRR